MGGFFSKSNVVGVDTKGGGIGGGAGSFDLDAKDKNFRTLVYKKRRLSDTTLEKIVTDPIVSHAFKQFLNGEFGEQKLLFWIDTDEYRKLPPDTPIKLRQERAETIYNKYLTGGQLEGYDVDLDSATREAIARDLGVKESVDPEGSTFYRVTCTDPETLRRVFMFASMKVFQDIKFSYLPVFITSPFFADLRGENGFFKDVDDATKRAAEVLKDMDMEFVLKHPLGLHYLIQFLEKQQYLDGEAQLYADMFSEVTHFESSSNAEERRRRLAKIIHRYNRLELPSLSKIIEEGQQGKRNLEKPDVALLQDVKKELLEKFRAHEAEFREHGLFRAMTRSITTSSVNDYKKVTSFNSRSKTKNTIKAIEEFSAARNLSHVAEEEISLERVMANSQGLVFFKKFVIQNFMEDSILFWTAVEQFKKSARELGEKPDVMLVRKMGQHIVDQYLLESSPMLVNISATMREEAHTKFASDPDVSNVISAFDAAQKEVFVLLKNNLWKKFQETPRFHYLKERFREREFIKETQGRVGQFNISD